MEYLTLSEAAKRAGSSRIALRRRVVRGELEVFADPLDYRKKLVRAADIERLREPRPIRITPLGPGDAAA
jgi:hypothetical protein